MRGGFSSVFSGPAPPWRGVGVFDPNGLKTPRRRLADSWPIQPVIRRGRGKFTSAVAAQLCPGHSWRLNCQRWTVGVRSWFPACCHAFVAIVGRDASILCTTPDCCSARRSADTAMRIIMFRTVIATPTSTSTSSTTHSFMCSETRSSDTSSPIPGPARTLKMW